MIDFKVKFLSILPFQQELELTYPLANWTEMLTRRIKCNFSDHNLHSWFLIPAEISVIYFTWEL